MAEVAVAGHERGAVNELKKRPYVIVFVALAVVTFLEVNVGIFRLPHNFQVTALIVMATMKASLVAAYYMHLRYEPRWLLLIPLGALALITVLVVALVGG